MNISFTPNIELTEHERLIFSQAYDLLFNSYDEMPDEKINAFNCAIADRAKAFFRFDTDPAGFELALVLLNFLAYGKAVDKE